MRLHVLLFLLFTMAAFAVPVPQDDLSPISCTQFIAWSAGGMSATRLERLARQRGLAFPVNAENLVCYRWLALIQP